MKVTFAQFHVQYKGKMYAVKMDVAVVAENVSQIATTVIDGAGTVLSNESTSGRQIISPWNAIQILRKVLTDKGIHKPRKKRTEKSLENI